MASMPSRPYDALYDPTFTASGARDHYRHQNQSGSFLIEKVPEHANLFSELQHYPTSTFRLKSNDTLPAFVDRSFHPHQHEPSQLHQQSQAAQVNGRQQFKYFRRPHLPTGAQVSLPLHLAPPLPQIPPQPAPTEPFIKDAATQSDYRENETQTLPWSPDWVLPTDPATVAKQAVLSQKFNCQGPEVLQLADLKFGDGIPGGLQEVRRLEKMREKRAFEASLPPIDDAERLPERQAMIEAWEAAEWAEREEEIKGVQDERLALLENALQVREEEIEEAHKAQVAQRTSALLTSKAPRFAAIQASRIKTIRLLAEKCKHVDVLSKGSTQKSSIIDKYADYGSAVYAPLQREGRFPDVVKPAPGTVGPPNLSRGTRKAPLEADTLVPTTLSGLQELQTSLPARALQAKLQKPKPPAKLSLSQRVEAAVQHDVETISSLLESAKKSQGRGIGQVWPYPVDQPAVGKLAGKIGKSAAGTLAAHRTAAAGSRGAAGAATTKNKTGLLERASTPEAPPLADTTGQHAALVLLQRLLRGRAVQNEMYAGKAAKLQLVRELRLGLEGTSGCQLRPEAREALTQELDAVIGAAVCRLCCLLTSDDEAAITQLMLSIAAKQQQQAQQHHQEPSKCVPTDAEPSPVLEGHQQESATAAAAVQDHVAVLPLQDQADQLALEPADPASLQQQQQAELQHHSQEQRCAAEPADADKARPAEGGTADKSIDEVVQLTPALMNSDHAVETVHSSQHFAESQDVTSASSSAAAAVHDMINQWQDVTAVSAAGGVPQSKESADAPAAIVKQQSLLQPYNADHQQHSLSAQGESAESTAGCPPAEGPSHQQLQLDPEELPGASSSCGVPAEGITSPLPAHRAQPCVSDGDEPSLATGVGRAALIHGLADSVADSPVADVSAVGSPCFEGHAYASNTSLLNEEMCGQRSEQAEEQRQVAKHNSVNAAGRTSSIDSSNSSSSSSSSSSDDGSEVEGT